MFKGARRRLVVSYAAVVAVALLLLGPVLYLAFSRQLSDAADVALRLAAQRQAALALVSNGITFGINPHFQAPGCPQRARYLLPAARARRQREREPVARDACRPARPRRGAARLVAGLRRVQHAAYARRRGHPPLHGGDQAQRRRGRAAAGRALARPAGRGAAQPAGLPAGARRRGDRGDRRSAACGSRGRRCVPSAQPSPRSAISSPTPRTSCAPRSRSSAPTPRCCWRPAPSPSRTTVRCWTDIVAEAEHMGRLVADLLTLARLDAGALPLRPGAGGPARARRVLCPPDGAPGRAQGRARRRRPDRHR